MVTEQMIIDRANANKARYQREYMKKYRAKNKERLNEYQRNWKQAFKEKHGISYAEYLARKHAAAELIAEERKRG